MKYSWLAATGLLALAACGAPKADEESVYRSYLAEYQAIERFSDRRFAKYLTSTARTRLEEALAKRAERTCPPCPTEQEELDMAKLLRPYPAADLKPVESVTDGRVTLTYTWREPPGTQQGVSVKGSDITLIAELIQEGGEWKLNSESWTMAEGPGKFSMSGKSAWSY